MEDILKLKQLVEFGIPMTVLARECHCTPTSIQNYMTGRSLPNGTKLIGIKDGLNHFTETINSITRE